jgi:uncharacterized membrane protein
MSVSEGPSVMVGTESIGRGRVEALSDGVFAIVVTLLVLEITARRSRKPERRAASRPGTQRL